MTENITDTQPTVDPNDPIGGGDAGDAFKAAIEALWEDEAWDELDWLEAMLGGLVAKEVEQSLPELGGTSNAVNDSFWGDSIDGSTKTNLEKLKEIEGRVSNDPNFDYGKWGDLLRSFRGLGMVLAPITAYEYYVIWTDVQWIRDNTKGWTVEEYVNTFSDLVKDVPYAVITIFAKMSGLLDGIENGEDWDEVIFEPGADRWQPAPVPVKVPGGQVQVTKPRKGALDWVYRPTESPLEGDWVDDLKDGLREELRGWLDSTVWHGVQPELDPAEKFEHPGITIEIPRTRSAREKWKKGLLPINFREWDPNAEQSPDPAEKWRLRKDKKMAGAHLYLGFLKLLNRTYGELDEIKDVWEAIEDSLTVEYADGRIEHWNDLDGFQKIDVLTELGHGIRLHVDGDGLIFELFMNELIDRTVGALSKTERAYIEEQGLKGVFETGNMSTWWRRWQRTQEAIREQQEDKREQSQEKDNGLQE